MEHTRTRATWFGVVIGAIMQHIEQAGVHSGDSACSLPPYSLSDDVQARLREQVVALARGRLADWDPRVGEVLAAVGDAADAQRVLLAPALRTSVGDGVVLIGDAAHAMSPVGGVGINLTAADYVIHMDPWWNPAVEDQASDRAHRMGQQRPVTI